MSKKRSFKTLLFLIFVCLIAGCVRLPEHARPRFHVPEDGINTREEGFGYRQLKVKDFEAESLTPDYFQYNHVINAQSCISIRPSQASKIRIVQSYYQDVLLYLGTVAELTFEAIFIPSCSWWNPDLPGQRVAYVLEHEQIHFALSELAARKLTKEAIAEMKGYLAIGDSYNESRKDLLGKLKILAQKAIAVSIEEHTDFDKEASLFYDPETQRKWLQKVNVRLAE